MKKLDFNLDKKVIIVTGGEGLLGRQFIRGIRECGGTAISADLKTSGELSVEMDITSKESVVSVIQDTQKKYGRIDGVVNNAYPRNKNYGKSFFDVEYSDFCENLNMNLGGYFLCCQQFAHYFKDQGFGNIVNISSIYGVSAPQFSIYEGTGMTMPVEYAAIKSGLIHLTKYIAAYLKGSNVQVNTLSLGGVLDGQPQSFIDRYNQQCLNKGMLSTEDVVGSLLFLLSNSSRYVNGQNIIIDDGFTL